MPRQSVKIPIDGTRLIDAGVTTITTGGEVLSLTRDFVPRSMLDFDESMIQSKLEEGLHVVPETFDARQLPAFAAWLTSTTCKAGAEVEAVTVAASQADDEQFSAFEAAVGSACTITRT